MDEKHHYAIETLTNLLYVIEKLPNLPLEVRHYLEMAKEPMSVLTDETRRPAGGPSSSIEAKSTNSPSLT